MNGACIDKDGNFIPVKIESTDHPGIMTLFRLPMPTLFSSPIEASKDIIPLNFDVTSDGAVLKRLNRVAQPSPTNTAFVEGIEFKIDYFYQLLAKIGHSFVCAGIGVDQFEPFLIPIILDGKMEGVERYIGGNLDLHVGHLESSFDSLHMTGMVCRKIGVDYFLIVNIRLFGCYGTPNYLVVVGKMRPQFPSIVPAPPILR